ncbi:MAG: hypothetical protein HWN68_06545 [Desulfobacterales bacterium]|nr:hypothetical protein [Desulfobacterales bacterium]
MLIRFNPFTGTLYFQPRIPEGIPGRGDSPSRGFGICLFERDVSVYLINGLTMFVVPVAMNGMNLVAAIGAVGNNKGIGGTTDIRLTKRRNGSNYYMFTTNIRIGDVWWADNCVIDPAQSEILTGDTIRADVVAMHSTAPKGLTVTMTFE